MGFFGTMANGDIKCDWCGRYIKNTNNGGFMDMMGLGIVSRVAGAATKHYCSNACKIAAQKASGENQNDEDSENTSGGSGGGIMSGLGSMIGDSFKTMSNEREDFRNNKAERKARIAEVTNIQFKGTPDDISTQLNSLFTEVAGIPTGIMAISEDKSLRLAIIEKLEFGIMKLRSVGGTTEADFFQKKFDELSKKKKK